MAVSKEKQKASSPGLTFPEDAPSKTQGEVLQLLDSEVGKVLPKDSVESPSVKKNQTDLSSKSNPDVEATVSAESPTEDSTSSKDPSNDEKSDEDEAKKKVSGAKANDPSANSVEPEEEGGDREENPRAEDIPEEAEDEKEEQEQEEEKEETIHNCDKSKSARRSRRACSAVVNYKISDSASESEMDSINEDTVDEDGDYNDEEAGDDEDGSDEDDIMDLDDADGSDVDPSEADEETSDMEERDEKETKESPVDMEDIVEESDDADGPVEEEEEKDLCSSRAKKRKKAPAKTNKTKASGKKEEGPSKKKSKGPRVSEMVIKHTADQMLTVLIEKYMDGFKEIPMDELAGLITNKNGKPYTNHRSDAIMEGIKRLKAQNQAEKVKYKNMGAAKLTDEEINKIPKEEISSDPQKVLDQRLAQFLEKLSRHKKGGNGAKIVSAANAVWEKLLDGKPYTSKQLVGATEYSGTNSSGFEAIMVTLKASGMVEAKAKGKYSFTEKVFPHGRP